jgi:uncharacterized coiled-coil DUF342 family protein
MPTGIEMMMKSMGIDPAQIKKSLTDARDEIMAQVAQINAKLDAIQSDLNKVLYPVAENEKEPVEGGSLDVPEIENKVN